jgi:hypothetical protein
MDDQPSIKFANVKTVIKEFCITLIQEKQKLKRFQKEIVLLE